jgi:hypothetical protein
MVLNVELIKVQRQTISSGTSTADIYASEGMPCAISMLF